MFADVFMPFIEKRAPSVMARAAMARLLSPSWVDEVFEDHASGQYTRELLFSSVFALMTRVVLGRAKSIHAAYQDGEDEICVSLTSVYNKLNGVEPTLSAALVAESGRICAASIDEMGPQARRPSELEGYAIRIVDGNCLATTEHRIRELRTIGSGPLPGKTLVVYDPERDCVCTAIVCEDGHTQERALLGELLETVQPGELWIEDRNFCTTGFLFGLVDRGAEVLVREHRGLPLTLHGEACEVDRIDSGSVWEQDAQIVTEGEDEAPEPRVLSLRRVTVVLKRSTRSGDHRIHILTTLPKSVKAAHIAKLYRGRWRIETLFQDLKRDFNSEISTLGYPGAGLFAFCVALVSYNVMTLVEAALRAEHGTEAIDEQLSPYHLANELESIYDGMTVVIPASEWQVFIDMTNQEFVAALREMAKHVKLKRYQKAVRGPKKPPPKREYDPSKPHVATARLLAKRKT